MTSNFAFLSKYWEDLAEIGETAEMQLFMDPPSCIFKVGLLTERIVKLIYFYEDMPHVEDDGLANLIWHLNAAGVFSQEIYQDLYILRTSRNSVVHEGKVSLFQAKNLLQKVYNLSAWFFENYGDWDYVADTYHEPVKMLSPAEYQAKISAQDLRIRDLSDQLDKARSEQSKVECDSLQDFVSISVSNDTLVEKLGLSVRALNALKRKRIDTVEELLQENEESLYAIRNVGVKTANELLRLIESINKTWTIVVRKEDAYRFANESTDNTGDNSGAELLTKYFQKHDYSTKKLALSNKAENLFERKKLHNISQLVCLNEEDILAFKGVGKKTCEEILDAIHKVRKPVEEKILNGEITEENYEILSNEETESLLEEIFIANYEGKLSGIELMKKLPSGADYSVMTIALGRLLANQKICMDSAAFYSLKLPSLEEMIPSLGDERAEEVLQQIIHGKTFEEIGLKFNISKQQVSNIKESAIKRLRKNALKVRGIDKFEEDKYKYLFDTYDVDKETWANYLNLPLGTYHYLGKIALKKGKRTNRGIENAIADPLISSELKLSIQKYLDRNYIVDDGVRIKKETYAIEDYVAYKFCKEDTPLEQFAEYYDSFISSAGLENDPKFNRYENKKGSGENYFSERCRKVLWKHGRTLRYYDIDSNDYSEFFETLNLEQYHNIEFSANKLMDMYPDLMKRYDVRDGYELHNLIRKTINKEQYPELYIKRMPMLLFGEFDRVNCAYSLMLELAPVTKADLCKAIEKEYGIEANTASANWLTPLNIYYHNGAYSVDYEEMPAFHRMRLQENLNNSFYYIDEIKAIYKKLFPDADISLVSAYNLKSMGFIVRNRYAIKGFESATAYFKHLLTSEEIVDVKQLNKKFSDTSEFTCVLYSLRDNREMFEFEPNKYISMSKLIDDGYRIEQFNEFCDEVASFVDDEYFTMKSLRLEGFSSGLDGIEYGDYFLSALLRSDQRFSYQKTAGQILFRKTSAPVSRRQFIVDMINREGCISASEILQVSESIYDLNMENWDIVKAIENTGIYFDRVKGVLYSDSLLS